MSRIEHDVLFERSVDVIFPFLADPELYPQWQRAYLEAQLTSQRPIGVGTTFRAVYEMAGRHIEVQHEVTAYIPEREFAFRNTSDDMAISGDISLQLFKGGTKAKLVFEAQLGGFFRLAEPLAERLMKQQQQADLERLKRLLHATTGGSERKHE
jgi:uncharacterized protein YndB with AHSA1/START domain